MMRSDVSRRRPLGKHHEGIFFEKRTMILKQARQQLSGFKLSTDLVSVEATTEKLPPGTMQKGKLSTDLVSVEATTEQLLNESIAWAARRFSLKIAAPTDTRSVESKKFHSCSIGVASQSLLPPTQGRWRVFSVTVFHYHGCMSDNKSLALSPV